MPDRKTRYPISLTLSNGIINDSTFKHKIKPIINEYGERDYITSRDWYGYSEMVQGNKRVWRLADEVDVRIRRLFENWVGKMMR